MQDDESISEQKSRGTAVNSSNWRLTAIVIVITALIAGTVGYLLGTSNRQFQQSPEWVSSTPPRTSLRPTLPQVDKTSTPPDTRRLPAPLPANDHICQQSYAISPDGTRALTVKVDSDYHRYLIIEDLSSTPTPYHELMLFDQQVDTDLWEPVTSDNWSPDGKYVYLLDNMYEGASNLYIFKSDGEPFDNNRKVLLASELGYNFFPMDRLQWISSTQIAFRAWPLPGPIEPSLPLTPSEYHFDIEKETITRIK